MEPIFPAESLHIVWRWVKLYESVEHRQFSTLLLQEKKLPKKTLMVLPRDTWLFVGPFISAFELSSLLWLEVAMHLESGTYPLWPQEGKWCFWSLEPDITPPWKSKSWICFTMGQCANKLACRGLVCKHKECTMVPGHYTHLLFPNTFCIRNQPAVLI